MKFTRKSTLALACGLAAQANDRPFESARTAVAEDDDQTYGTALTNYQLRPDRKSVV